MEPLVLYLPFPPTVNHYWSAGHGKSRFVSAKGRMFRLAVQEAIVEQYRDTFEGRLQVSVLLHPGDRRKRDLDNYMKALLDALTHAGVWLDDEQIDRLVIERGEIKKGGACVVEIMNIRPLTEDEIWE